MHSLLPLVPSKPPANKENFMVIIHRYCYNQNFITLSLKEVQTKEGLDSPTPFQTHQEVLLYREAWVH
jgi:hypothetical protein